jgi:ADP-ribose pyrophosphatase
MSGKHFGDADLLKRDELWRGNVGSFGIDDIRVTDGRRMQLALLRHPGAAAVVPFVRDDVVLMLRQYRYAVGATIWEIPAGKLDEGEDPLRCAVRELEEETGYTSQHIEPLGLIHTTPGFTDEIIHLFCARALVPGKRALDADELIDVVELPLSKVYQMVEDGEITDGKTICALFHLLRRRQER